MVGKKKPDEFDDRPRVVAFGVGGAGVKMVKRICDIGYWTSDVEVAACNSDTAGLSELHPAVKRFLTSKEGKVTDANRKNLVKYAEGTHLMFICAGIGGGTGTEVAPFLAEVGKKVGAIVIAIVTLPLNTERSRVEKARDGLEKLSKVADTVVVLDLNVMKEYAVKEHGSDLPLNEFLLGVNEIAAKTVKALVEPLKAPATVSLELADIPYIFRDGNLSAVGIGKGEGPGKVEKAVKDALEHLSLEVDYKSAKGVFTHTTLGDDGLIGDANKVSQLAAAGLDPSTQIVSGAGIKEGFEDEIEVITFYTGFKANEIGGKKWKKEK